MVNEKTSEQKKYFLQDQSLYMKQIKSLKCAEEKVAWLLYRYPKLRNDDKLLIAKYWQIVDIGDSNKKYLSFDEIFNLTSTATITRVRRRIQNDYGLFLPTDDEVIKHRNISQQAYHDWSLTKNKLFGDK